MATAGGGNFYYIARPSDTLPVFAQEIKGLTFLVADELMMCMEPSPKVQFIRQLNDYDVTTEDGTIRTSLGGIFYHEKKNALFEFMVPPHLVTGRGKIADVWLEYVAVGEGAAASARRRFKRKTPRMAVEVNYGSSEAVEGAVINKEVVQEVELMQVAAAVSSAKEKVNEDDLEGAMQVLVQVRKFLRTRDFSEQRKKDLNQLLSHFYEELRLREDPARTRKAMTTTLFNLRRGKLFSE
jgi:Ca-activated chloride channel family protein